MCSDGDVRVGPFGPPARRDALVGVGCFAVGVLVYLIGMDRPFGGAPGIGLGWRIAVFTVACAGQLWRTRAPLTGLGVGVAAVGIDAWYGATLPVLIVLADLLYTATLHASRRASQFLVVRPVPRCWPSPA